MNTALIQERVTDAVIELVTAKLTTQDISSALERISTQALDGLAPDDQAHVARALKNMIDCLTW